jgi:hypothetical protein
MQSAAIESTRSSCMDVTMRTMAKRNCNYPPTSADCMLNCSNCACISKADWRGAGESVHRLACKMRSLSGGRQDSR